MSTILCNNGDERKTIEEAKEEWVKEVLIALGANEDIFGTDVDLFDSRQYLDALEIEVWPDVSGNINIYRKQKLVAQWKEPKLLLIKEGAEMYYKITTNEWALPFQMRKR